MSVLNGSGVAGNPVISLPGSSKGDMIVHNGSENTRVAGGANGEALVVDPSGPTGVRWAGRSVAGANGVSVTNGTWTSGDTVTVSMPGSVRGDIMVHNGITNTRVAAGPDGQVLTADSTQPVGLKWASVSMPTLPTTTKGDIMVHNGTQNQRLAAGSTAQTLVADLSQAAGLKWAARSVSGGNGLTVTNGDWATGDAARIDLPGTNKGDISVHNGTTNSVLTVGENGTVLTADSTSANGVKWSPADHDIRFCQNVNASITGTTTMTDLRSGIVLPTLLPGDMVVNEAVFSKTLQQRECDGRSVAAKRYASCECPVGSRYYAFSECLPGYDIRHGCIEPDFLCRGYFQLKLKPKSGHEQHGHKQYDPNLQMAGT